MAFAPELLAQNKNMAITCKMAGEIPPSNGRPSALGVAGPVTGIVGNYLVIAGGANFPDSMPWEGGLKKYYNDISLFTGNGDSLLFVSSAVHLPENVAYSASVSTSKGILYAGGENEFGLSGKVYLLKWDSGTNRLQTEALPDLPVAVTNASATAYNNLVFVAGGETKEGVSDLFWSMDITNPANGWIAMPSLPKQISHAVFVSINNKVVKKLVLAGGRKKTRQGISELYNSVYAFDPELKKWSELIPLPYPLSAGTGVAYEESKILLFGGDRGTTFSKVEKYQSLISKSVNEKEREKLIRKKNQILASHPGFSKQILSYDIVSGKFQKAGSLSFPAPVTTTAFWWGETVVIPSGEIKAGVRTPAIWLLLLNRPKK